MTRKGMENIIPFSKSARYGCVELIVFPRINWVRKTPGTSRGFMSSMNDTPNPRAAIPKRIVPKAKPYAVLLKTSFLIK
jgi:hypothetical protein